MRGKSTETRVQKPEKRRTPFFPLLFILWFLVTGFWLLADCHAAPLRIHFLDVGEGDSILIQTPRGRTVLIDAGNLITGFDVTEYLKMQGIKKIDRLIFTHHDLDHIGGAFFILPQIDVAAIYDNGHDLTAQSTANDIYRWYEELVRKRNNYGVLEAEDKFVVDGVVFDVLWPYAPPIFPDFNSNSLVIMVKYKSFKCLLTGDITIYAEKELLDKEEDLGAEILKVSHHGSFDGSTDGFLAAVSPQIAVVSVNKNNIHGYPAEETLARLKNAGAQLYRTDKEGNVIIEMGRSRDIKVTTKGK